jgi:Mce-associated membrane protein
MIKNTAVLEEKTESAADVEPGPDESASESGNDSGRRGRRIADSTIKLRTIVSTAVIAVIVVVIGVLGWQLNGKSNQVDQLHSAAAGGAHAEQVALDYATGAAQMDFHDLASWQGRLTKGTSPELSNRLTQAATSMEQIITPLQWVSTATPIAAKVTSDANGIYSVDCFVSVLTKNSQAPDGIESTATYRLALDSRNNWLVTDVGSISPALQVPGAPKK